jgi:hypothetical protein
MNDGWLVGGGRINTDTMIHVSIASERIVGRMMRMRVGGDKEVNGPVSVVHIT